MSERLRWQAWWLAVGWALAGAIVWLSLMPGAPQPVAVPHADKVEHALAYFVLTGWFAQLYRGRLRWLHAGLFLLMGVAIEFLQEAGGDRLFEWADMAADAAGIGLALWLSAKPDVDRLLVTAERILLHGRTGAGR